MSVPSLSVHACGKPNPCELASPANQFGGYRSLFFRATGIPPVWQGGSFGLLTLAPGSMHAGSVAVHLWRKTNPPGLPGGIVRLLTTHRAPQKPSSGERTA